MIIKMRKSTSVLLFLTFIAVSQNYGQVNVDNLYGGYFEVEYGCITSSSVYEIDFMGYKVTNLVDEIIYDILQTEPTIFDNVHYQSKSFFFEPVDYNSWQWNHPSLTTDTIILETSGYYQNLECGTSQGFTFGATEPWYGTDRASIWISIVTSMSIDGPYLDCTNPVTYNLLNMPSNYTSATWTIKQNDVTKSSGSGTTAIASNLTDGRGEVTFTVSFTCGLESLQIKKDFWFGKPVPSIVGSDEVECYSPEWYFIDADSYQWGDYQWSTDYNMEILSTTIGHKAEIQGLDEGYGQIFLEVTNECGSNENRLVVYVNCSRFLLSPNPASDNVQVTVVNPITSNIRTGDSVLDVYKLEIYDLNGLLHYSDIKSGSIFTFPVINLKNGNYIVKISDGKNISSIPIVIKH